jgi:Domain of unknown function (DUF4166)/Saccharopine dehydrogenase NADP binding domain
MTPDRLRILILGGYGVFGGRLVQLLADEPRLTLIVAGRSEAKAQAFCGTLQPTAAMLVAARLDRDGEVLAAMAALAPDIVVDASGPFQDYGSDRYRVVQAALALKIDYLDLADSSEFVGDIGQFDTEARAQGVYVLAGASSFPVLTVAVVRHLARDMAAIEHVTGGIAPSPYAGVGLNVIKAIASYAGKPVPLTRDGRKTTGTALVETMRATVCPPGRLPLHNTRFALVDVPDLQILPQLWPAVRSVWMGAGPVPEILHRMLNALAWLVHLSLLPSLTLFAPAFHRAINVLRWGEHRGGMFVSVEGRDGQGQPLTRSWHLLAEGGDGPLIPSMAIEGIVRKILRGERPVAGARSAVDALGLADYEALFATRTIFTGTREVSNKTQSHRLYQRVLGDAWMQLAAEVRAMHAAPGNARGRASVERGTGLASQAVARLFGFPRAATDIPVEVTFTDTVGDVASETWRRRFGEGSFSSEQSLGAGRDDGLIVERFGPFKFGLAVVVENGRLNLVVRRWSAFGVPMPQVLAPTGVAYEYAEGGRFRFHVKIALPVIGLIVRYRGFLVPSGTPVGGDLEGVGNQTSSPQSRDLAAL